MSHKKSQYKKGPKGKVLFYGGYAYLKKSERVFILVHPKTHEGIAFDSPAAAKKAGWIKV